MKTLRFAALLALLLNAFLGHSQPTNKYVSGTMVNPPNAAAFEKYGDIPVSYVTGVPDISVPIHELNEGPLSLPISLSYHASGIRLSEMASWVGQGWSLFSGGIISRTVQGIPDEKNWGYYSTGSALSPNLNPANCPHDDFLFLKDVANGQKDTEPDLFSFNINGYSGKFFIDHKDATAQGKPAYQFIPKQDLKLDFPSDFSSFTLTTPDGTRYIFGKTTVNGSAVVAYDISKQASAAQDQRFITSWYLLRVETPDQKFKIELTYVPEAYSYWSPGSCKFYSNVNPGAVNGTPPMTYPSGTQCVATGPDFDHPAFVMEVEGSRLKTISTSTETVDFVASATNRQDVTNQLSLSAIEIRAGDGSYGCKKFTLTQDYFSDPAGTGDYFKRLRLTQMQESSCDNTITKPAFVFTYEGNFVRNRLSKAIDHWGFDNGVIANEALAVNVPNTTIAGSTYGSANRESVELHMLKGVLKEIKYPTGGKTSFVYEGNRVLQSIPSTTNKLTLNSCTQTIIQCCGTIGQNSTNLTFTAAELAVNSSNQSTKFKLCLSRIPPGGTCSNATTVTGRVRAFRTSDNAPMGSWYSFNHTGGTGQECTADLNLNLLGNSIAFQAGVSYYFRVEAVDGYATLTINTTTLSSVSKIVGGLRVKEIRVNDGISAANDIVKTYEYAIAGDPNTSSGLLYAKPEYGIALSVPYSNGGIGCSGTCSSAYSAIMFSSESLRPLSNLGGAHIYYSRVRENYNGNGYKVFNFTVPSSTLTGPMYPATPDPIDVLSGKHKKTETYDSGNNAKASNEDFVNGDVTTTNAGVIFKVLSPMIIQTVCAEPAIGLIFRQYGLTTRPYRLDYVTQTTDGITITTDYEYDSQNRFLAPTAQVITNSNGQTTRHENRFVHDYQGNNQIRDSLIRKNMIATPVATRTKVNGTQVAADSTVFAFFNLATGAYQTAPIVGNSFARVYRLYKYEMTYNGSTPTTGVWDLQGTIQNYNTQGLLSSFLTNNWTDPETYIWTSSGLMSSRTYKSHTVSYSYYPSTKLLLGITDIDGRKSAFIYDKLMRTIKTTQDGANYSVNSNTAGVIDGNVKTEYTYTFPATFPNPPNYITTQTTYTTVTNSSLNTVEAREYFDGLGRPLQSVKKGWSPSLQDVVEGAVQYDNQGRVTRQYTPFTGGANTGAFTTIPGTQKYTSLTYEASPLNRQLSATPPDWHTSRTFYGSNIASEVAYYDGSTATSYYPANTLIKTTALVPQTYNGSTLVTTGTATITFKDKKGRLVLSRRQGVTWNGANPPVYTYSSTDKADTYYLYDNKDRLARVYPPGVDNTSAATLYYQYAYDASDRMTSKRVPDQDAATTMYYNNRDQLTVVQDPRMAAASPKNWLQTQYDDYGRPIKTGLLSNNTTPNPNMPSSWTDIHTETTYGTSGINLGKVTQAKTYIPGLATPITRDMTYDAVTGRLLTNNGNNHMASATGGDNYTYTYDYSGNVLTEVRVHKQSSTATALTLTTRKTYDQSGRNNELYLKINTNTEQKLGSYTYDFRDRLQVKGLGWSTQLGTSASLQALDYSYNEQNWLTAINATTTANFSSVQSALATCSTTPTQPNPTEDAFGTATTTNDLFKLNLYYDAPQAYTGQPTAPIAQRGGNISQIMWQVRGRERQLYNVTYDYLDRMRNATYLELTSAGVANTAANNRYQEKVDYADARGNISKIIRKGMYKDGVAVTCWSANLIDSLSMTYHPSTNRLMRSTDLTPGTTTFQRNAGFNYGAGTTTVTYTYDGNGNLSNDPYKAMNLTYNHLDLPTTFDFGGGKRVDILYDRAGQKLRKTVYNTGSAFVYAQDYVGGLEYRTSTSGGTPTLEAIYHAEGRITPNGANWRYEYNIKDHLSNTRLTFADLNGNGVIDVTGTTSTTEILTENHYYPFGLNQSYDWTNNSALSPDTRYQYNDKEMNDDWGLNLNDYGARWYDASTARWQITDPISDFNTNPYAYVSNSPLCYIDPKGMSQAAPTLLPLNKNEFGAGTFGDRSPTSTSDRPDNEWTIYKRLDGSYSQPVLTGYKGGDAVDYIKYVDPYKIGLAPNGFTYSVPVSIDLVPGIGTWYDLPGHRVRGVHPSPALTYSTPEALLLPLPKLGLTAKVWRLFAGAEKAEGLALSTSTNLGTHLVYKGVDRNTQIVRYIGITGRDFAKREFEHKTSNTIRATLDYTVVPGATNLTKLQARIWEQTLINQYGFSRFGGTLYNQINSIAPKYWLSLGIK